MKTGLFTNEKEETYFYNLLAARKLRDKRREREGYEVEIETALETCGGILKEHGSRSNFIEDIHKLETSAEPKSMSPPSSTREESQYAEQIAVLTTELKDFLKKLPLEITEDLGFYSKQITDRRQRRDDILKYENNIIELYPESEKVDYEEIFSILNNIFVSIAEYTREDTLEKEESIDFEVDPREVKGIKKAPESILRKANLIDLTDYQEKLAQPITRTPIMNHNNLSDELKEVDITEVNHSFSANPVSLITEAKLNEPLPDESISNVEKEEIKSEDIVEETIKAKNPEMDVQQIVEGTAEKQPERVEQEATFKKETQQLEDKDLITFEMPEDFTLTDLATALCGKAEGWIDIYEANKKEFDKIIQEKNNGISKNVENNEKLFAGLTIKIPVYELAKEETLGKTA
ncbi:MAG: hypothetical protein PHX04_02435 [Bacilli bacterium]|nr:hypothetical protein [Bacilli bacterium]